MDIKFDETSGVITYKNTRYLLIRPETIVEFQKEVEKVLGDKTIQLMSKGSYIGGGRSIKKYKETFKTAYALADVTCKIGTSLGWGRFTVARLTDDTLIIDVGNSVFATAYGKSTKPVCHYIRGVVEALGESIYNTNVETAETKCIAKGDSLCRFVVKVLDNLARF